MQTSALAIVPAPFTEKPNALVIQHVSYDEWLERGKTLYAAYNRIKWHLIDWIGYGLQHFADELEQALFESGVTQSTFYNCRRIFNAYPTEQDRVADLSPSHHEAVIVLQPQARYQMLERAAREGMNRDDLRDEVRRIKGDGGKVEPYRTDAWITRDGVLHISGLPVYMQGKDVTVTVKLLEVAA